MPSKSLWATICAMLVLSLLAACGGGKPDKPAPTPEEMIAKSWKLDRMEMAEQIAGPEVMANSSFTFYKNGRYEILLGELERGKWELSADKKVLITVRDGTNMRSEMDIVSLTNDRLVFTNTGNASPMTMELVPVQ